MSSRRPSHRRRPNRPNLLAPGPATAAPNRALCIPHRLPGRRARQERRERQVSRATAAAARRCPACSVTRMAISPAADRPATNSSAATRVRPPANHPVLVRVMSLTMSNRSSAAARIVPETCNGRPPRRPDRRTRWSSRGVFLRRCNTPSSDVPMLADRYLARIFCIGLVRTGCCRGAESVHGSSRARSDEAGYSLSLSSGLSSPRPCPDPEWKLTVEAI